MKNLFVDIPRCAGTAILSAIGRPEGVSERLRHLTCRDWVKTVGHQRWAAYTRFAVVRHPIDRFVSAHRYLTGQGPWHPCWESDRKERETLTTLNEVARWPEQALYRSEHFRPQILHLIGESGTIEVQHVLRFERLKDAWEEFAEVSGSPPVLPTINASHRNGETLTDDSRAALRKTFAVDFEVLNYE